MYILKVGIRKKEGREGLLSRKYGGFEFNCYIIYLSKQLAQDLRNKLLKHISDTKSLF